MPGWLVSEGHMVSGRLQWLFCHGPLSCWAVNNCGNSSFWFCDFIHSKFCFRQTRYIFQRSDHKEKLSNFREYLKTKKTCLSNYFRGRSDGYWQSVPMFLRISSTIRTNKSSSTNWLRAPIEHILISSLLACVEVRKAFISNPGYQRKSRRTSPYSFVIALSS